MRSENKPIHRLVNSRRILFEEVYLELFPNIQRRHLHRLVMKPGEITGLAVQAKYAIFSSSLPQAGDSSP